MSGFDVLIGAFIIALVAAFILRNKNINPIKEDDFVIGYYAIYEGVMYVSLKYSGKSINQIYSLLEENKYPLGEQGVFYTNALPYPTKALLHSEVLYL
jgi:hypothetical protein